MSGVFKSVGKLVGSLLGTNQAAKAQESMARQQAEAARMQEKQVAEQTAALRDQNAVIAAQTEAARVANQQQMDAMRQQQEVARQQMQNERELADINADKDITSIEVGGTAAESDPKKRKGKTGSLAATLGLGV